VTPPPVLRPATLADLASLYHVCLKTGDHGQDAEAFYSSDPDALGRIYVGPYVTFEPELSFALEDDLGVCGYVLAARDSHTFYQRYEQDWRPGLCRQFRAPTGDSGGWTRLEQVHHAYHDPDYFCPEPYAAYPSHLHLDLLPRVQGRGHGRRMIGHVTSALVERGSPGVHLGVSVLNTGAQAFYRRLGFSELTRMGTAADGCIYMGMTLPPSGSR
jgi:ribosomal protein S18 acetylase RimI-like enzyme